MPRVGNDMVLQDLSASAMERARNDSKGNDIRYIQACFFIIEYHDYRIYYCFSRQGLL